MPFPLIPIALGALGGFLGRKAGGGGDDDRGAAGSLDIPPEIRALIDLRQKQAQRQQLLTDPGASEMFGMAPPEGAVPLQGAIAQLAYSLLPDSARAGLTMPGEQNDPGRLPFTR